jgi:hypothetical protein
MDFWETSGLGTVPFVQVDGHWRSVLALTTSFARITSLGDDEI